MQGERTQNVMLLYSFDSTSCAWFNQIYHHDQNMELILTKAPIMAISKSLQKLAYIVLQNS